MKTRITALILIICMIIPLLCSCGKGEDGFTSERSEGGVSVANVNIRSLKCEAQDNGEYTMTFAFSSGSRISGDEEEKDSDGIPEYSVQLLNDPMRIVVSFASVSYWDFSRNYDLSPIPMLRGLFRHSLTSSDAMSIYFSFSRNIEYKIEETKSALKIHIVETEKQPKEDDYRYFVTANAYKEYCADEISRESELYPVLCSDGNEVVLMSKPLKGQAEAEAFMDKLLKADEKLEKEKCEVIALYSNELPLYNSSLDYTHIYEQSALRVDGKETVADVFIEDGIYLTELPNGSGYIYSKLVAGSFDGNDEYSYEEIWFAGKNKKTKRYIDFEFAPIEKVVFSPDGHKLAVLENETSGSHLYVFNTATDELAVDLSLAGFGKRISSFIFNDLGTVIYAISGSSGMNIHSYDFSVVDETKRHTVVLDKNIDEGSLDYYNGELYYVMSSKSGSFIYKVKPEGGIPIKYKEGSAFAISGNRKNMAITCSSSVGSATEKALLKLVELSTGKETVVCDDFAVYDFAWNADSSALLYIENRLSGSDGEGSGDEPTPAATEKPTDAYPYTLWCYRVKTGTAVSVCDIMYSTVLPASKSNLAYLPFYDPETLGGNIRGTFVIKLY